MLLLVKTQPVPELFIRIALEPRWERIHNQHPVDELVGVSLVVIADGVELFRSHPDSVVPAPEDESFFSSGCAHVCHPHKIRNCLHSRVINSSRLSSTRATAVHAANSWMFAFTGTSGGVSRSASFRFAANSVRCCPRSFCNLCRSAGFGSRARHTRKAKRRRAASSDCGACKTRTARPWAISTNC